MISSAEEGRTTSSETSWKLDVKQIAQSSVEADAKGHKDEFLKEGCARIVGGGRVNSLK